MRANMNAPFHRGRRSGHTRVGRGPALTPGAFHRTPRSGTVDAPEVADGSNGMWRIAATNPAAGTQPLWGRLPSAHAVLPRFSKRPEPRRRTTDESRPGSTRD